MIRWPTVPSSEHAFLPAIGPAIWDMPSEAIGEALPASDVNYYLDALLEIDGTMLDSQRMEDVSANSNHLTLTSGRGAVGDGVTGFGYRSDATGLTDVASFSVVFWINPGTLAAGDTYLARWDTGATKRVWAIKATGTTPTTIAVMTSTDGTAESTWTSTANHLVNGTLIHVVWTYNAGVAALYVNGALAAGAGDIAATLFGTDIGLSILSSLTSGAVANAASGTIRDVQFYSVVLSAAEAAAMFADPEYRPYVMGAGLELDCRCSSSLAASLTGYPIIDRSGNGRHGVWTGCAGAGSRTGGPQSALESFSSRMWFNGTSQYITLAAAFSPGTADFTVSAKFMHNGDATVKTIFDSRDAANDGFLIFLSNTHALRVDTNSVTSTLITSVPVRVPCRVTFTRVGNLGTVLVVRLDTGATVGTTTVDLTGVDVQVTAPARIGARAFTVTNYMAGTIWDINLNGTLIPGSGNQVADWQTGCTVTGSPGRFMVPAEPGLTTDAFNDTCSRIRRAGALNLIGEAEYGQFAVASPPVFTFMAWVQVAGTTGADQAIIDGRDGSGDGPLLYALSTLASWRALVDAGSDIGAAITAGTWKHVAAVFTGTAVEVFVDGVGTGSATATTMAGTTANMRAGVAAYTAAQFLRGQLAHPAVFPTALAAADILAIFDDEKATYGL